jgi:hypothetical protein
MKLALRLCGAGLHAASTRGQLAEGEGWPHRYRHTVAQLCCCVPFPAASALRCHRLAPRDRDTWQACQRFRSSKPCSEHAFFGNGSQHSGATRSTEPAAWSCVMLHSTLRHESVLRCALGTALQPTPYTLHRSRLCHTALYLTTRLLLLLLPLSLPLTLSSSGSIATPGR